MLHRPRLVFGLLLQPNYLCLPTTNPYYLTSYKTLKHFLGSHNIWQWQRYINSEIRALAFKWSRSSNVTGWRVVGGWTIGCSLQQPLHYVLYMQTEGGSEVILEPNLGLNSDSTFSCLCIFSVVLFSNIVVFLSYLYKKMKVRQVYWSDKIFTHWCWRIQSRALTGRSAHLLVLVKH